MDFRKILTVSFPNTVILDSYQDLHLKEGNKITIPIGTHSLVVFHHSWVDLKQRKGHYRVSIVDYILDQIACYDPLTGLTGSPPNHVAGLLKSNPSVLSASLEKQTNAVDCGIYCLAFAIFHLSGSLFLLRHESWKQLRGLLQDVLDSGQLNPGSYISFSIHEKREIDDTNF